MVSPPTPITALLKESEMRMLVRTASGDKESASAQTGAPASASTPATPIARSNVLLPDMFEPVMSNAWPFARSATSLGTRAARGIRG